MSGTDGLTRWLTGPDLAAWASIGSVYRRNVPAEGDATVLRGLLSAPAFATEEDCAAWVRARVAADFAEGRVVVLGRWQLAVTEARLCALAATIATGSS